MRIGVPLAVSLGWTRAVRIFVGRHGRIRADSRDSARACRFRYVVSELPVGTSPDSNGRGGAILQTSALPLGYGAGLGDKFAGDSEFLNPACCRFRRPSRRCGQFYGH